MINELSQPRMFYGVVEDREDPMMLGRCRIRIAGIHTNDLSILPTEDLDWSMPAVPITSASMNGIGASPTGVVEGTWVIGFSRDEIYQETVYFASIGGIPGGIPTGIGFSDPNDIYPRADFINEPDTNRLARNERISETIVQKKRDAELLEIYSALTPFDEPSTEYAADYPHNHVRETESGHIIELDDTQDKERVHLFHKAGTFFEIYPNGQVVVKNIDRKFEMTLKDNHILIQGNEYIRINGNSEIRIDLNRDEVVSGNQSIKVLGDAELYVDGNCTTRVGGDYFLDVIGNYNVRIGKTSNIDIGTSQTYSIGESSTTNIIGDHKMNVGGTNNIISTGNAEFGSMKNIMVGCAQMAHFTGILGANFTSVGGAVNMGSVGGSTFIGGTSIFLDSCSAGTSPTPSAPDDPPESPEPPTFMDIPAIENELDGLSDTEYPHGFDDGTYPKESLAKRGVTDFDAVEEESESIDSPEEDTITPAGDWDSRHFTIGQVSSAAVVSHYTIKAQHGLSAEEVQDNLNYLCVNVLDRIKDQYPEIFVTSGFRHKSTYSKHEFGIAGDIQAPGWTNKDYFECAKWIAANLETDALLVEYKKYGTKLGWIHVGFNKKGNRGIKATYYNNRKHSGEIAFLGNW